MKKNVIVIFVTVLMLFLSGGAGADNGTPTAEKASRTAPARPVPFQIGGIRIGMTEKEFQPLIKKMGQFYSKVAEMGDGAVGYFYRDHPDLMKSREIFYVKTRNGKVEIVDYSYILRKVPDAFPKKETMERLIAAYGWPDTYEDDVPLLGVDTGYYACWGDCYVKEGVGNSLYYNGIPTPFKFTGIKPRPRQTSFKASVVRVLQDRFDASKGIAYSVFEMQIRAPGACC